MSANKDWRVDIAPILFFTAVIGVKSYYLLQYIRDTGHFWSLITDGGNARAGDGAMVFYVTGHFSHLAYYATALAFDALVLYSFLVRRGARQGPRGFWENIFPLVTVFVPMIGFTLMFIPEVRAMLPHYPEAFLRWLAQLTPAFPFYLDMTGLALGLFGAAFSIWAIAHLRASFGLRTAVRELVTSGPYRRIRHPLYVGEIIHVSGIALLAATPAALYLLVLAVALQAVRAKIEERKFLASVPEYAEFRRNTGFLWPKVF